MLNLFIAFKASQSMIVAALLAVSGIASPSSDPVSTDSQPLAATMATIPCVSSVDLEFSYSAGLRLAGTNTPIGSLNGEPSLLVAVGSVLDPKVPIRISFARTDESAQISNGMGTVITLAPPASLGPVSTLVIAVGGANISIVGNSSNNDINRPPPPAKAVLKPVTTCPRT